MQKLINIQTRESENVVSARELHQFLDVKERFSDWIKRMFGSDFQPNEDYFLLPNFRKQKGSGGHNATDYLLTIDTAKEIAMMQRTAKGREARQYFIACEKALYAVKEVITTAQYKALECQKEGFDLLGELQQIKRDHAPVFKRMSQIKKRLKALQNATFQQLGLFQKNDSNSHE